MYREIAESQMKEASSMAWDKKKRDDGSDELFSENARLERERKQGAIDDAQAMADASGTPEEELEVPKDTWGTVRRLWHAAAGERWRFGVVIAAILVYTGFHVAAPAYSARVIDVLWTNIQAAFAEGRAFAVGWETGGRELATYFGIWTGACALYSVQCFVMAGFAEKLNLSLRRSIAEKLSRLPLKFYDGHKPGEVVSRATNDLDKMSEVLQTGLLKLMSAVGTIIGALYMMLRYSVLLTAIFLVFAFVSTLITKGVSSGRSSSPPSASVMWASSPRRWRRPTRGASSSRASTARGRVRRGCTSCLTSSLVPAVARTLPPMPSAR